MILLRLNLACLFECMCFDLEDKKNGNGGVITP